MRKLITILFTILSIASFGQTKITAPIVRNSPSDISYGTHYDSIGYYGFRTLYDTVSRNNIPSALLKNGTFVYTYMDSTMWRLDSAQTPVWVVYSKGSPYTNTGLQQVITNNPNLSTNNIVNGNGHNFTFLGNGGSDSFNVKNYANLYISGGSSVRISTAQINFDAPFGAYFSGGVGFDNYTNPLYIRQINGVYAPTYISSDGTGGGMSNYWVFPFNREHDTVAGKGYVDGNFVTLNTYQTVTGQKEFNTILPGTGGDAITIAPTATATADSVIFRGLHLVGTGLNTGGHTYIRKILLQNDGQSLFKDNQYNSGTVFGQKIQINGNDNTIPSSANLNFLDSNGVQGAVMLGTSRHFQISSFNTDKGFDFYVDGITGLNSKTTISDTLFLNRSTNNTIYFNGGTNTTNSIRNSDSTELLAFGGGSSNSLGASMLMYGKSYAPNTPNQYGSVEFWGVKTLRSTLAGGIKLSIRDTAIGSNRVALFIDQNFNTIVGQFNANATGLNLFNPLAQFQIQNQNTNATAFLITNSRAQQLAKVDSSGYVTLNTQPVTSGATYRQLTYNTSTGAIESVASGATGTYNAHSFLANNSPASTSPAFVNYFDSSGVYSDSIVFTGTTAPSGATTNSVAVSQRGKLCTITITLSYATPGSAITLAQMKIPSWAPVPSPPTGLTGASNYIYPGAGRMSSKTAISGGLASSNMYANAAAVPTGYWVEVRPTSSSTAQVVQTTITYQTL